jgi:L-aspartate oxidase
LKANPEFPGRVRVPVLVLGSGIAGLAAAFTLARRGVKVLVLTKAADPSDCNTGWAQGGIIYFGKRDSPASLVRDVLRAGAGLCNPEAVRLLAHEGPRIVEEVLLKESMVPFSRTTRGDLDFTREGAHSVPRIVHAADATGLAIETALLARVKRERTVTIWSGATAIDLITARHHSTDVSQRYALQDPCLGAYVLDGAGRVHTVLSDFTVLATGGVGRLFLHTTNTAQAIGDGLAMADRAGAVTQNLEYVQFHPTTLYHEDAPRFLISEALRGEGAVLVNRAGEAFMHRYDRRKDLAPRDVVTRAIVEEMTSRGEPCVYLDLAHHWSAKRRPAIAERFPTIAATCATYGVDIAKEPIPVVPAAHYFCGGVLADLEGKTTIRQLYAVGETSCTGVHGANRLASTSLLEGLVWGTHAARSIADRLERGRPFPPATFRSIPDWRSPGDALNEDPALLAQDWATIRSTMWNYVGIVRTTARLARAVADLRDLEKRILRFYQLTKVSREIVDLFHGVRAASLIAQSAFKNPVSRGCHYRKS